MNRFGRPALALLPALTLCLFSGARTTYGQIIPNTVKTAPDVTAQRTTIQQYVDAAAKRLTSDDADEQSKGRNQLIDGVSLTGGGAAAGQLSVNYLDTYSQAAAKALAPLTGHADMRVRLNAAIAAARIAEKANNLRLVDVAVRFMNDKAPAVALWGVKAARAMVPATIANAGNSPLIPSLIATVQRNPLGPVVTEIYRALSLDIFIVPAGLRPPPAAIKAVVPHMMTVFRYRVNAYARGAVPADPSVDNLAADFLTVSPVWQQMTPPQQTQAVQLISDLLGFAGQYAELMAADERQALIPVFQRTGKALQVVGETLTLPGVVKAAKDVQGISTGMDGTEVRNRADAVALALKQAPQFKSLKPAAQINMTGGEPDADAAPEPATGSGASPDGAAPPKAGFEGKGGPSDGAARPPGPRPPALPPVRRGGAAPPAGGPAAPAPPAAPNAGTGANAPASGSNGAAPAPPPTNRQNRPPGKR